MWGFSEWGATEFGQSDGIVDQIGDYVVTGSRATFNGFSLDNNVWVLKKIPDLGDLSTQDIVVYDNPRNNGRTITGYYYRDKVITLTGAVVSDTEEGLREEIARFKAKTYKTEGNLDIIWGDKTYRLISVIENATFRRADEWPLYRSEFSLSFRGYKAFWQEIGYTTPTSPDNITEASRTDIEIDNTGSAGTPLVAYISWQDATSVTSFDINSNTTEQGLTITEVPTTGDIWLIDGINSQITKVNDNSVITNWTGTFIELLPDINSLDITVASSSHNIAVTFKFKKYYT